MTDRIPEMRRVNQPDVVKLVVGQELNVSVYENDRGLPMAADVHGMLRSVISDVLTRAGIDPDRSIEKLCEIVAESAIGRLVTAEGFRVTYGDFFAPTQITDVTLRPSTPTIVQAQVVNRMPDQQ